MTRYERVIKQLDNKPEEIRFICKSKSCACKGCCGVVGGKRITQAELDSYNSGEMAKLIL